MAASKGWRRPFDDAVPLPGGGSLVTLEDAAQHIQRLPKAEAQRAHWQLAVETLINCAEGRDFLMHARIAVLRSLNHDRPPPEPAKRRKPARRYTILR